MQRCMAYLVCLAMLLCAVPALAQGENFSMAGCDTASIGHVWEESKFFTKMTELTGVSFTFDQSTDTAEWSAKKTAMFASGELPDVLFKAGLTDSETLNYYEAGQLIDLRPYLAQNAPNLWARLEQDPALLQAVSLPDGAIVALPTINEMANENAMWINKTWLDNLGLAMPTTAEELTQVLTAFRDLDPNKNGKRDEIPLSFCGMWDLKFLGHAFGLVANDYNVFLDAAGQVQTTLGTSEQRAFLTWLNQLWSEKLIDHDGFSTNDTLRQITKSDADMIYGVLLGTTPLNLIPAASVNQYVLLEPLTYAGGQVYRELLGEVTRGTFAVTSACKDPAAVLRWVDVLYTEEGSRLAQAGVEGETYTVEEDGTWDWVDDASTVAQTVLAESTITDGGDTPGLISAAFQLQYNSEDTRTLLRSILRLQEVSVQPMPLTWMADDTAARLGELQMSLGSYAETAMARFVTGDTALSDEAWSAYSECLTELGVQELISIWQSAVDQTKLAQ